MKVHIGNRIFRGVRQKGITIYSDAGAVLYNDMAIIREPTKNKFDDMVNAFRWGVRKFKILGQNKTIDETEPSTIFISSKTLYTWLEKETSPSAYSQVFMDALQELSLLVSDTEIELIGEVKVAYQKPESADVVKATDFFAGVGA